MKKDECRFTIRFNPDIPEHAQAIQLLNESGRAKASLIASALTGGKPLGNNSEPNISMDIVRNMILEILRSEKNEMRNNDNHLKSLFDNLTPAEQETNGSEDSTQIENPVAVNMSPDKDNLDMSDLDTNDEMLKSIASVINSFKE